jgi:predicted phage terminase large subunit-like protein
MPQNRSLKKSKRARIEDNRARLREIFQSPVSDDGNVKGFQPKTVLEAAFDLANDIEGFVRKYLPHYMIDQETGREIEPAEFHKEIYRLALTTKRAAVAAPREHAKSTVISLFFVLYCVCYKLRRFIVLISNTEPQAILLLSAMKIEIETNDALIDDFGSLVNDVKWGEKDIVTVTGIRVVARGAGQSLRGLRQRQFRPDLVICDDLEDDESVENPESRAKLKRWFKNVVLNLGKTCQVFVLGTILHFDSLLAELLDEAKFLKFMKRKFEAVDDDFTPESVLWPGMWPLEALKDKEADIGPTEFNQEYRNRPVNTDTQSFKEADIIRHAYRREHIEDTIVRKITGIDPAISKKEKADDFASVTIAIDDDGYIYVTRAEDSKMSFPEQWRFILNRYDEEHPEAIGVETVAYQKALKEHVDEESRKSQRYIPLIEIHADTDKFRRITTMSPLVENGTIRFCLDGTQKKLISQLIFLGKIKDDLADALEIAVRLARVSGFKPAIGTLLPPREENTPRGLRGRVAQQITGTEQEQPMMDRNQRSSIWDKGGRPWR